MLVGCFRTRTRLTAFINGELTPAARRSVARHIDRCEACHRAYVQERDLARDLSQRVTLLGRPEQNQLDRVWFAVQDEMSTPKKSGGFQLNLSDPASYGLAAVAVMLTLLLPLSLRGRAEPLALQLPPEAHVIAQRGTQKVDAEVRIVLTEAAGNALAPAPTPGAPEQITEAP